MQRLLLAPILVVALVATATGRGGQNYHFSIEEAIQLANQLLASVNPSSPENAYMPPLLREKVNWVYVEHADGRLLLNYAGSYSLNRDGSENKVMFMKSRWTKERKALIEIYSPRLLMYVRIQQGVRSGYNDMSKDFFAISLAHEAIHLEIPADVYLRKFGSFKERLKEEERTWRKVDLGVIRPMLAAGRKIDADFIEADNLLRQCHDRLGCPGFTRFLRARIF